MSSSSAQKWAFYVEIQPTKKHNSTQRKWQNRLMCRLESEGKKNCSNTEKYEKTAHKDPVFHKFQKTILRYPWQCMRYIWGGEPLLISNDTITADKLTMIPNCEVCGSKRTFEMQLLPTLISHLYVHNKTDCVDFQQQNESRTNLDFGCVYVFSCALSCWDSGSSVRKEFVLVQPDPDALLITTDLNEL